MKQYVRDCHLCGRTMISHNADAIFCGARCAKRSLRYFDPARSRRPLVACAVCGHVFAQSGATGRLRVCCPIHYGGYRACTSCGKRCRPKPGGTRCRHCKTEHQSPITEGATA